MAGMMTAATLRFDAVVGPIAVLGGLLGVYVLARIPQQFFDVLALGLAGVAAVRLILA